MLTALISLCIVALVLYLIYFLIGKFVQGTALQILGIILALILVVYALRLFGVAVP